MMSPVLMVLSFLYPLDFFFFLIFNSVIFLFLEKENWVMGLIMMSVIISFLSTKGAPQEEQIWGVIILFCTISFFITESWFSLYIWMEISIIPLLFIIMGWGLQVEKIGASLYLLMYMLIFSFPFLLALTSISKTSLKMFPSLYLSSWGAILMIPLFLVKTPLFSIHLWLPKAHVESSTMGSMFLASLLLKMGSYGLVRSLSLISPKMFLIFFPFFSFCVMMSSLSTFFQSDMKSFVAYSSISHMNFSIITTTSFIQMGKMSSMGSSLSHGFVAAFLFMWAGYIFHSSFSRLLIMINTSFSLMSLGFVMIFSIVCANFGVPPSMAFSGEIIGIVSSLSFHTISLLFVFIYMIMTCMFSLYLIMESMKSNSKSSVIYSKIFIFNSFFIFFTLFLSTMSFFFTSLIGGKSSSDSSSDHKKEKMFGSSNIRTSKCST